MALNSYKPWTEDDILLLENMYQYGASSSTIARALNRSSRAIDHGIKHMLIQQCMYYGVDYVAEKFKLEPSALYNDLAPPKYLKAAPLEEEETEGEFEVESEEEAYFSFCQPSSIVMMGLFTYFAVATIGYMFPL